jgi:hypothetical protein
MALLISKMWCFHDVLQHHAKGSGGEAVGVRELGWRWRTWQDGRVSDGFRVGPWWLVVEEPSELGRGVLRASGKLGWRWRRQHDKCISDGFSVGPCWLAAEEKSDLIKEVVGVSVRELGWKWRLQDECISDRLGVGLCWLAAEKPTELGEEAVRVSVGVRSVGVHALDKGRT